ncbi:MAG: ImmA/IrrE family metallo-endopeptidase [Phycisphaerales bacterium]|nr:MAG: ImmA/IrrE family metallo-endopeptidase [Phycisphaerales bacterium]
MGKALFNPEMLILARESRGYTQTDLARATGYAQSHVSRYENGTLPLTEENVAKMASALNYPVAFFGQGDTVYGLGSSFLLHRKRQSVPATRLRRLQAEINVARIRIERLLRGLQYQHDYEFVTYEVDEHGTPEEIAQMVRFAWQMPDGPIRNLTRTVESTGAIVLLYPFGNKKIDGLNLWVTPTPPLFFLNDRAPGDRSRWTLAHEIGHAVMHRHARPEIEDEADRFASEFLMPEADVRSSLVNLTIAKAASLKLTWRVSMQALVRRAKDLDVISHGRYKSLCVQIGASGMRTNEPNEIEPERPANFEAIVAAHQSQHGYGLTEIAHIALAEPDDFVRLMSSAPSTLRIAPS